MSFRSDATLRSFGLLGIFMDDRAVVDCSMELITTQEKMFDSLDSPVLP